MVRMMEFIKDYLSIDETLQYLGRYVYPANFELLQDLEREGKLKPLVYLKAHFLTDEKFFNFEYELVTAYFEPYGFIFLDHYGYDEAFCDSCIFLNWGSDFNFKIEKIVLSTGKDDLTGEIGEISSPIFKHETNSQCFERIKKLDLECIRFKKSDLDKLFNQQPQTDNSELVQQLQAENERLRAELQKQLKQQAGKDTQSDTPADGEPTDKGQGDSLLILGAVMETMPKLKPNYTQQSHIAEILETYKSVSGISQSTLEKKFSQAKRYLKQCIN